MHHIFTDVMPKHLFADQPSRRFGEALQDGDMASIEALLAEHHQALAAVIIEPVVQGTGGMNFYAPEYVTRLRQLCDQYDVLLILDEIATGFGRTGKLFACEHAGIAPDIMCLGKTMAGGYLSLAATLCNDKIARGISEGEAGAFMHGPTFMANPLACAVSHASIELLLSQDWQHIVSNMAEQLNKGLAPAKSLPGVKDVRVLGSIGVIEMEQPVDMATIQEQLVAQGIWLRPFGRLIYTIPPYTISDEDIATLCQGMVAVVKQQT
jgi:adenosylmethionine-8-amino-7-oxononanoate aminotransferase